MFDATADDAGTTDVDESLSNAVLCRGSSQGARSITTYGAHNTAHTAAAAATRASTAAARAADYHTDPNGDGDITDAIDTSTDLPGTRSALSRGPERAQHGPE